MNVVFLTLADISSLHNSNIYTDLLQKFVNSKHFVQIVSPTEQKEKKKTYLIYEKRCNILKVRVGNIQKTNIIEKGISMILIEGQFIKAIKKHLSNIHFDLVLYSTPPITLVKAVDYLKKRDDAKSYLLLKDIFPQNAVDLKMMSKSGVKGVIYKYFRMKEKRLYQLSDFIGCMSQANVDYVLKNNTFLQSKNIEICPNSIEPTYIEKDNGKTREIRYKYNIPLDRTVFIYGGNLGKPQGIDFLIECLLDNKSNEQAYFLIVGSGTEYNRLKSFFDHDRPINAQLIGHLPKIDYDSLVNSCDVGLIFLDHRFTIPNFPSRMLSYMQASMPILAATDVNTDVGQVIENGRFGFWCESRDVHQFSYRVRQLCDASLRSQLGKNARSYLEMNYTVKQSYEIIMKHFIKGEKSNVQR